MKAYDAAQFNEDMKELKRLVEMAKEEHERLNQWQAELEARERALRIKEEELNRKLEALSKQQSPRQGEGVNLRPETPKPQFKVRLDKLLWETFKLECKRRGLKPNETLEKLIRAYLSNPLLFLTFCTED